MILSSVKVGSFVRVLGLKLTKSEIERLNSYGITKNSIIKVERNLGGIIVSVNGRLIALSSKIADSIEVNYANSDNG